MVPDEVRHAKAEREKQKRDFMALLVEEKKQKVKFTSVMDIDLLSLTEATRQVDLEAKRLATLNIRGDRRNGREIRQDPSVDRPEKIRRGFGAAR